MVIADKINDG